MPTRRGLGVLGAALVLCLAGLAYGVEEFVLLAMSGAVAFAAGLVLLAWSAHRARRSLIVEIVRPDGELTVGAEAEAVVVLVDEGARPLAGLRLEAGDGWTVSFPGLPGTPARSGAPVPLLGAGRHVHSTGSSRRRGRHRDLRAGARANVRAVPVLEPGRPVSTTVAVPTDRRGLWSLAPRRVWCVDPLGLATWRVALSPPLHLVVCPAPGAGGRDAASLDGAGRSEIGLEAHGHTRRSRGGGDELAGLRPYVPGDHLNRLHWPVLARTGEFVVRDFVEPEARRLEVEVDDRPNVVDEAVSGAAARALSALGAGTVVDLVTRSGDRFTVAPGPAARTTVLEALAVVAPAAAGNR